MSQEQAKACIEKMKTDEAFRAKVLAVEKVAARMQLINAEGFACSAEEIEAVSAELMDADLARVAGGGVGVGGNTWMPVKPIRPTGRVPGGWRAACLTEDEPQCLLY